MKKSELINLIKEELLTEKNINTELIDGASYYQAVLNHKHPWGVTDINYSFKALINASIIKGNLIRKYYHFKELGPKEDFESAKHFLDNNKNVVIINTLKG